MFPNLTITCTECTKKNSLEDFLSRAFDRMQNFWQGNENRPVLNRMVLPQILNDAQKQCDINFSVEESFYASMKFELDSGYVTITFYPYPNSMTSDGNKFPSFDKPVDIYYGKYVL